MKVNISLSTPGRHMGKTEVKLHSFFTSATISNRYYLDDVRAGMGLFFVSLILWSDSVVPRRESLSQ